MIEEYLTTNEVATILKCSIRTVERRIEDGKLTGSFKDERKYLIPKSSVLSYIDKKKKLAQV